MIIRKPCPFIAQDFQPSIGAGLEQKATGNASAEAEAALALFHRDNRSQLSRRISQRVIDLLDRDKAFAFMMDDARKNRHTAKSKQKLGYSIDQMSGAPVAVENVLIVTATTRPLQWVQLSDDDVHLR